MEHFSIILNDLRERMSEVSAMYVADSLTDEVYRLIATHAMELTVTRMMLFKNKYPMPKEEPDINDPRR